MRAVLAALVTALTLTGCVIHTDDNDNGTPPPASGDITFLWDFEGRSCAAAGIKEIHITLQGARGAEPLQGGGVYPCTFGGVDGVTLKDFLGGSYDFTLEGIDGGNRALYFASGNVQVNGSVERRVTLNRQVNLGNVQLFWGFGVTGGGARKTCAAAGISGVEGVTEVEIQLNGGTPSPVPCVNGGVDGVAINDLAPGSYSVDLWGYVYVTDPGTKVQQRQAWYYGAVNVMVEAGKTKDYNVVFDPIGAGATFKPLLRDRVTGNTYTTCAAAGVKALAIKLKDKKGAWTDVFWTADCDAVLATGFHWDYLLAFDAYDESAKAYLGDWTARIEGWDAAASNARVIFVGEKAVQVTAGYRDQLFTVDTLR